MAGTAVVGAGNYSLEIDTGFIQDAFLLDDAVAGVLDNTQMFLTVQLTLLMSLLALTRLVLSAADAIKATNSVQAQ